MDKKIERALKNIKGLVEDLPKDETLKQLEMRMKI